jgi:hypothetical protein
MGRGQARVAGETGDGVFIGIIWQAPVHCTAYRHDVSVGS